MIIKRLLFFISIVCTLNIQAQTLHNTLENAKISGIHYQLFDQKHRQIHDSSKFIIESYSVIHPLNNINGYSFEVTFENISNDTISIENVLPLNYSSSSTFITGKGNHPLSRTHLFVRGRAPINVIVPDNAWELGFVYFSFNNKDQENISGYGLSRRNKTSILNGKNKRFETILFPHGSIQYTVWVEQCAGDWQTSLLTVLNKRKLFDVVAFNDTLYKRKDLQWMQHAYTMHLMMSWDKYFYNRQKHQYSLIDFIKRGNQLYGGDDIIAIWPTWPTLGLDQRNQFDLFNDLPGGLPAIKNMSKQLSQQNKHLFISYNPWDRDTRFSNHLSGLSWLIDKTNTDGVVLDTWGNSSDSLQLAADSVRKGVIMYSEGMAVPKDMQCIISGRVHNALYYSPMLNLNKFIEPRFSIFRVAELYKEPIAREFYLSLFNGYGTEVNIMAPGEPEWVKEQYAILKKTSSILRNFSSYFHSDSVKMIANNIQEMRLWVNEWNKHGNTVYTIYSTLAGGFKNDLLIIQPDSLYHYVDVYHHKELVPHFWDGNWTVEGETNAFNQKWLGTNNEGAVDCIFKTKKILQVKRLNNVIELDLKNNSNFKNQKLIISKTDPLLDNTPITINATKQSIDIHKYFGLFEGKLVFQLFEKVEGENRYELIDETILELPAGEARMIPYEVRNSFKTLPNKKSINVERKMVVVPNGPFQFKRTHGENFISYPRNYDTSITTQPSFSIDVYPVTNQQYEEFLKESGYTPAITDRFLHHWVKGHPKHEDLLKPVVNISYEDAMAYAQFYHLDLPTEIEWQYAAQTSTMQEWPWNQMTPVERITEEVTETLSTIKIKGIDSSFCNLGKGKLDPIGTYKKGVNPLGISDLVGSVWQMTKDVYQSGSYRYNILKGGSYFNPSGSWWYVQSGPRNLTYAQYLLWIDQGFERNNTVGFRCIKRK